MLKQMRIISLILCVAMLICIIPATSNAANDLPVWDGSIATEYEGGSGTEDDPYQISNGAQLALLAHQANNDTNITTWKVTRGTYYVLTNDIILNDYSDFDMWGNTPPKNLWTPIGTPDSNNHFWGNFDGNGHSIYGLYVCQESDYSGLFGSICIANVFNVSVKYGFVTAGDNSGGITGYVSGCSVKNCHFDGYVSGTDNVGGIAGHTRNGTIENCSNKGRVNGTTHVGGIVGEMYIDTTVQYCYNTGNITGSSSIGGIVGRVVNQGTQQRIKNCYNSGTISGTDGYIGGIVGDLAARQGISYCYNVGNVTTSNEEGRIGGIIGNREVRTGMTSCYYLETTAETDIGVGNWYDPDPNNAKTQEEMTEISTFSSNGYDFETIWCMNPKTEYPYPEFIFEYDSTDEENTFDYKSQFGEATYTYNFDSDWFLGDTTQYNHELAKMSMKAAVAAYDSGEADRSKYITALMEKLGFENIDANYPEPTRHSIGSAIASSTIHDGDESISLIMVAVRGGGYGTEWGGNLIVGTEDVHDGFQRAASQVETRLKNYLEVYSDVLHEKRIIWVMGYSRAAATANLVAKSLCDGNISGFGTNNVFAYCFECPQNTRSVAWGNPMYDNIMNIVNAIDFVPKVVMSDWGYARYGQTFYLPYSGSIQYAEHKSAMIDVYAEILRGANEASPEEKAIKATVEEKGHEHTLDKFMSSLADIFDSPETYTNVQDVVATATELFLGGGTDLENETELSFENYINTLINELTEEILVPDEILDNLVNLSNLFRGVPLIAGKEGQQTHYAELCLAWLESLEGETSFAANLYRKVIINCPVNVSVYDSSGSLVGQIIDGVVQEIEDGVSVFIDLDGQMIIALPCDEEYRIELAATDEGTVTYTVVEHNIETSSDERVVSYFKIGVKAGDELTGTVENLDETEYARYPLTMNGSNVDTDVDLSGDKVEEYKISCSAKGNGTVCGGGLFTIGEYCKVSATADNNAEFLGWYENGRLVSSDEEYRFLVISDTEMVARFSGGKNEDKPVRPDITIGSDNDSHVMMPEKGSQLDNVMDLYQMQLLADDEKFSDVYKSDWFYNDVMSLVNIGIINGYPNGSFQPKGQVTWGEALKMVLLGARYGEQAPTGDHWASGYMDLAIELDFIPGPVDLNAYITRGEMADLTASAMKLSGADIANPFDDEAPASAVALYNAGIIKGSADDGKLLYRAESTITRAEISAIIWRVYCAR